MATIKAATHDEIELASGAMGYNPSRCCKGIAILEEKSLGACVLYDYWTINSVQVHVFAPSLKALFNAESLREIFTYPFITARRSVLVGVTPSNQKGSLAVSAWLGFREKYRIRDGWSVGVDMVLKELRREDCRFLSQDVKLQPTPENLGATPIR